MLLRAGKADNSNEKGKSVLQLPRVGAGKRQQQESHSSPETVVCGWSCAFLEHSNDRLLIVQLSSRSSLCFPTSPFTQDPKPQQIPFFVGEEKSSERLIALNVMETFANE